MIKKTILNMMAALAIASGCTAAQKTDVFTTKNGKEVKITCIKHASLQIQYDGLEIEVDPVSDGVLPATDYAQFPKANVILVTHEHRDHFDREAIHCLRTPATTIYTNQAVYNMYHNGFVVSNGDSIAYRDDVILKVVPAYNTTERPEGGYFHPKGRYNGYVLTLDGLAIYIAGDTEPIPEMAQLGDIDVAFLPCNQPYTMTIDQLVEAAKTIRPKVLFPYHYSNTIINQAVMKLAGTDIDVRIRDYK